MNKLDFSQEELSILENLEIFGGDSTNGIAIGQRIPTCTTNSPCSNEACTHGNCKNGNCTQAECNYDNNGCTIIGNGCSIIVNASTSC